MRILIAEDEVFSSQLLQMHLEELGHEVVAVSNGKQALEKIETQGFRFLVTDWVMPELDGLELVRRLRARKAAPYVYIIVVTAKTEKKDVVRAIMEGADDFLTKPFDPSELQVRVRAGERILELEDRLTARNLQLEDANRQVERANRRMKNDLEAAAKVQEAMLPSPSLDVTGADFAWHFKPCHELAGDHLNIIPVSDSQVAFYVLDVVGKGVQAALLAVSVNRVLVDICPNGSKENTSYRLSPKYIANQLSHMFSWDDLGRFFTMTLCLLDLETRECRFTCAGHPGPVLLTASGKADFRNVPGYPIGLSLADDYEESCLVLEPGDRVFLYSDGIVEAENTVGDQFGSERLQDMLETTYDSSLEKCVRRSMDMLKSWRAGAPPVDDISLLAVEVCSAQDQSG